MLVIPKKDFEEYLRKYSNARKSLLAWYDEAKNADWKSPEEIKKRFVTASIIGNNRVVFNIGGNKFRLIVHISYERSIVKLRFFGTHSEYDKINAETI